MKKKYDWFLCFCIITLVILIFCAPSLGWQMRQWFNLQSEQQSDQNNLISENSVLKAQIAELQTIKSQLPNMPQNTIRAMVYSRYPMNFKNEILVDVGKNEGVIQGKAVLFNGVFIGRVEEVFSDSALVQTVFDGNFKMPVRIGSSGYDALLTGGTFPKAGSILKNAPVKRGDIIITADSGFSYGLPIGTVHDVGISSDNLFEEATIDFAYDANNIQTVVIEK